MSDFQSDLLRLLEERGHIHQLTDAGALDALATKETITGYVGFDPTAHSLHVGNLASIMLLRRVQQAGHRPIVIMGGGTAKVGDPSGKDDVRKLLTDEVLKANIASIHDSFARILRFNDSKTGAILINNDEWLSELSYIDLLRDVGKHFTINRMLTFDSVKLRLDREQPLTFLEFNYMILQAYDFLKLSRDYGCKLQLGGSDQWGNMVSGIDLIRRKLSLESFALTLPLITKADGAKFGKSQAGAVWLERSKTSPYSFYQFWLNTSDADVEKFLKFFTFIPSDEIVEILHRSRKKPEDRIAQRVLAEHMTRFVHGEKDFLASRRISNALFSEDFDELEEGDLDQLLQDGLPSWHCKSGEGLLSTIVSSNLAKSNGEARKLIQGGGIKINGKSVDDPSRSLDFDGAFYGKYLLLKKGKKSYVLLCREH